MVNNADDSPECSAPLKRGPRRPTRSFHACRLARALLRLFFRVEVRGREHYAAAGERVLIVINPGSLLDPLLIGALLPIAYPAVDRAVAPQVVGCAPSWL